MKKTRLFITVPLVTALLCSCSGNKKEVTDFAADFVRKVQDGQIDSLKMVYPQIEDADSIAVTFVADSLRVDDTDKEGVYNVNYGNGVAVTVRMDGDGRMTVLDSRGLFAYPKEKEQFARKTGALNGDLTDAEKAKRMAIVDLMAEDIYSRYSDKRQNAIVNLGLTITKDIMFRMDEGAGYYTLKNTTDRPIKGNEYTITWEDVHMMSLEDDTRYRTETGKDIPANGTVKFPVEFTEYAGSSISKITMKELSNEEFMAGYTPVGNEYEREFGISDPPRKLNRQPEKVADSFGNIADI